MFAGFTADPLCTLNGYFGKSSALNYYRLGLALNALIALQILLDYTDTQSRAGERESFCAKTTLKSPRTVFQKIYTYNTCDTIDILPCGHSPKRGDRLTQYMFQCGHKM